MTSDELRQIYELLLAEATKADKRSLLLRSDRAVAKARSGAQHIRAAAYQMKIFAERALVNGIQTSRRRIER